MKNESLDPSLKLAESNFILSKIRELNNLNQEVFVKWFVGGAFNGGGFFRSSSENNSFVHVYFYEEISDSLLENQKFDLVCSLPSMNVLIDDQNMNSDTKRLIIDSNHEISELPKNQSSQILTQIKRFQISIGYKSSETEAESFGKKLINQIFKKFSGKTTVIPTPEFLGNFEIDAEIILDDIMDEQIAIENLQSVFPEIRGSLYGFGFNGSKCVYSEIKYFHLTARHF